MDARTPRLIEHFSTLATSYDIVLSDVWGVVHNGVAAYPEAGEALARFRAGGGTVVLVSNSPRPGEPVKRQLDHFGVIREAYDGIVTSGDVTRGVLSERPGANVLHIGPQRDLSIFDGLDIHFTTLEAADCVVCSGLFDDEVETAEDYRDLLGQLQSSFADPNWATPTTLFTGFAFTGLIYFAFCFGMSRYSLFVENRLNAHRRN